MDNVSGFVVQDVTVANPPTLLLLLEKVMSPPSS
jgi:hypothetical protein